MKFYKIRAKTGLYSTGGAWPRWSKLGKTWTTKGHLSAHFTNLGSHGQKVYATSDAVVVECEIVETSAAPVADFIKAADDRKIEREQEQKRRALRIKLERAEAEYNRLRKESGL